MVHTIYAPSIEPRVEPPGQAIERKNYYCKHRVRCTAEERKTASLLGGHTWNIVTGKEDHEVFLRDVRNDDHGIDREGKTTGDWCHRRRRIDADGDGILDVVDSSNLQEVMVCPATAGKEAAALRARQAKQLCQVTAPSHYGQYTARRAATIAPPTPGRAAPHAASAGPHDKKLEFQHRLRDVPAAPTPRMLDKGLWSARRGEARAEPSAPEEHELYRRVDQLRTESHVDVHDADFADAIHSARRSGLGATGASAVSGGNFDRSTLGEQHRPGAAGVRHSSTRVEAANTREITRWPWQQDRLKRGDAFHAKPMHQSGSSSVKYDILSNERKQFVY